MGKSTGIVSTARITHATPACTYAHVPDRDWENNKDLPVEAVANNCTDIAAQLIAHPEIQVVLGGGRQEFLPLTERDPEYPLGFGQRTDGRNLIEEWQTKHTDNAAYVWNQQQFNDVDPESTEYLFGLFEPSHMQYESNRQTDSAGEPSIAEMTEKAIRILRKNPNGFFLAIEGKSTGIVSTARITHATPACTYAHVPDRDWENNKDLPVEAVANNCTDIAAQLIAHPEIQVVLGGGRQEFLPLTERDPEYPLGFGQRTDGRNLIEEWQTKHTDNAAYVWNQQQFNDVDPESTEYLFGLFEPSHMQYESNRQTDSAGEPSIAEMTEKAIRILRKNPNGFFLAIEAGRIDHGHHDSVAYNSLHDTVAMDTAVQVAMDMTDSSDTLIIVTADHSHTFTFAGYPERGHDIFGMQKA
ncbi:putative alkaline phosphatase, tissue-nonspecific isozyme-like [Apostichopus japonicus]|uniref:alkaline phosphatase n=1 Tax=Stichopus japonicus TaxID=307972 RepID=A0A2G8LDL6_STIJA|nr:putative alkaline phosphatase, tissue-nonspecific isozyme-like [Apostichopus japonicus]